MKTSCERQSGLPDLATAGPWRFRQFSLCVGQGDCEKFDLGRSTTPVIFGSRGIAERACRRDPDWWTIAAQMPRERNLARQDKSPFPYGHATAAAASVTGKDQAQSASRGTAAAAMTQPNRKPTSRCTDLLSRSLSVVIKDWRFDSRSINDRTVLIRLPVITAVEIAPGIAKRSRAY